MLGIKNVFSLNDFILCVSVISVISGISLRSINPIIFVKQIHCDFLEEMVDF
jgi:hypothetical protein